MKWFEDDTSGKPETQSKALASPFGDTGFTPRPMGHNSLEDLNCCPKCRSPLLKSSISTQDGRTIPVGYCINHLVCLPQIK